MTIDSTEIKLKKKYTEKLDELRAHPARGSKYIGLKKVFLKM